MAPKFRSIADRNGVWITRELLAFTVVGNQLEVILFDRIGKKKRKAIFGKRFDWNVDDALPDQRRFLYQ